MADVFISYAREDREQARRVALGLSAMGLEPFWDTDIPPGQTWSDYIEAKLTGCKAAIVLWSAHSVKSQWVREEARIARDKSQLIPAMLESVQPPFGFGEVQAADLSHWRGDYADPAWTRFAHAVYAAARGGEAPAPPQTSWTSPQPMQTAAFAGIGVGA
ncbi:MAG: toll/interleukin-1 receptor domain-containing protein, partial [Phycisphaerales bacterium]|nr:toll/interleukin-1 receptor domain-containing protein [Hyphomonadaceae bacterium]